MQENENYSKTDKFMLHDRSTKQSKDNKEKEPRFKSWLLKLFYSVLLVFQYQYHHLK